MAQLEDLFIQENEVSGEVMFDILMKAIDKKDNKINRDTQKETTKDTIYAYLKSLDSERGIGDQVLMQ